MRHDRKGFPAEFKKYVKGLPERGQHVTVQCGNLVVTLWQDTKPFFCSSTNAHPNKTVPVTRKKKDRTQISLPCPQSVVLYNEHMGGVDRNDQLQGYYQVRIKCQKYYKYIFWCLFDVAITNMFLLCRDYSNLPYNSTKEFQIDLTKDLIVTTVATTVADTVKDVEKQSGTARTVSCFFVIMVEKMTVFDFTILFMVPLLILREYKPKPGQRGTRSAPLYNVEKTEKVVKFRDYLMSFDGKRRSGSGG